MKARKRRIIHGNVHSDEKAYWAECVELAVVTQGRTLDQTARSFKEALALYLEGEDLALLGLSEHLQLQLTLYVPLDV